MACNIITPQIENLAKSLGITSVEASNIVSLYQEQVEHKGQFPSVDEAKVILGKRSTVDNSKLSEIDTIKQNDNIYYQQDSRLDFMEEHQKLSVLSHTYKTLSAVGSISKIDTLLKNKGINQDVRKLIVTAIELNPELKKLSALDVFTLAVNLQYDDLLKVFHENYNKEVNEGLEKLLKPILDKYHITIVESDMKKFGGALGVFDILNKVIYLAHAQDRNATTMPEEFAHAFVELLGTPRQYKKPKQAIENKDFRYLMDNVESTAIYKETYEQYKTIYIDKEENPDVYRIKKEAIGKALAAGLLNNFEIRTQEESSFWSKLKGWFNSIIDKFKNVEYSSFDSLIHKMSKEILNGDLSRLEKVNNKGYKLLNYAETLANQTKQDGGKAIGFLDFFKEIGNIITGSLAYRYQGTVYRGALDSLHDIDMIVPYEAHGIDMSSTIIRTLLKDVDRSHIIEWLESQPYFTKVKAKYPKVRLGAAYSGGDFITVNAVYSENEALSDKFLKLSGSYASRLEHFTEEERKQIYLFDFFLKNKDTNTNYVYSPEGYKLAKWNIAFVQKQFAMGRAKDIFDYQMWQRFDEFKDTIDTDANNLMYQKSNLKTDVNNGKEEYKQTDEFRRVQEAVRGSNKEQSSGLSVSSRYLNPDQRQRLANVLGRQLGAINSFIHGSSRDVTNTKHGTSFKVHLAVNPQLFHDIFEVVRYYTPNGELVDLHDDYSDCKCFLTEDGTAGFAIEPNGNLVSVFNLGTTKGFLSAIKDLIREAGATHLDAYASSKQNLEMMYAKTLGFHTASTMDYNMEYDHDDIAKNHDTPKIVFMVNHEVVEPKHFDKDSYDEAQQYQLDQLKTSLIEEIEQRFGGYFEGGGADIEHDFPSIPTDLIRKFENYYMSNGKFDFTEEDAKNFLAATTPNFYEGIITPDANTIFVFGSNPEGRHGAGAAKVAREKFGAKYGQGEGLQGNAYALPTKDLRVKENNSMRSIPAEQITENIRKMYDVARQNPSKYFKVAYTHGLNETSLNGYTGAEMIKMFKDAGPIPSNVIFSKNWTDHWNEVAFNISTQPAQSTPVTQENFKPEYQLDRSKLEADTRYDQLRKDMSSRTIELRAQYISSEFTHRIYSFSKKALDNLKNQLEELKKGNRFQKRKEIAQLETKIFKFETAVATNDIARIVETIGIQNIFDDIKKEFQEYAQMSVEEFEEEFGIDNPAGPNEYKKIVDNFEALKDYALYYINMRNGIKIEKEEAKKNKESIEQDDNEDDETRIAEGNTGWAFKVRNKDPYTTVSAITKQILNGIPLLDKKGNIVTDDLGNTITLNGYYAHSVLMHELCNIKSSNEFVVYDEHGKPVSFPALESMKSKYPWVNKLINHLKLQPQYISTVYSDLRQDFIPYWTIKTDGRRLKTIPINVATARESLLPKVTHNYEYGELQDENSIFDTNQKMVPDNIKLANTLLNEAEYARHQEGEAAVQECLEKTTKVLKMLGFPVDIYDITGIYNMPSGIDNIGLVIMYAQQIVDAAPNYKGDDFVDSWIKQGYGPIADIIGKVDEDCTMDTFKVGGKSYYSFSAPNFLNTLIKCLGNNNDEERRAYIDEHFKKYKWFYDEATGWKSPLLEMLYAHNGSVVADKLAVMNLISYEDKPYRDWTKKDISKAAIAAFFAEDPTLSGNYAWYQVNIFADSPVTNFVRLPKVNDSTNFKTIILQDLEKVVRQEIWRNGLVQDRKKNKAAEIVNFDKNGQSYHFFPELNTYKFTNGRYKALTFNQAYKAVWNELHDSNPTAFDAEISKIIQSALLDIMNKNYASFKKEVIDGRHLREELMSDTFDKEYGGQKFTDKRFYELMENYYWNTVFAKTQIIELTSGDPAFYNGEIDFQKRYKEVYASGARLNTALPWESGGRKFERTIYLSDFKRTSPSYQSIKELLQKAAAEGKFGKDANIAQACVDDILNKLKDINATDGQAYRSLSSYRSILKMLGKWSDSMEETFNHFQESKDSNGKWDMRDFYTVWNTLKPFVFSIDEVPTGADPEKFGTVMPVPHQNKNSEFLLLSIYGLLSESMNNSPQMRAINQFMEDYNIDVVQFESSAKVGGQGIIDLNYSRKKLNALLYNKDKTLTALGKEVLSGKYKGSNDYEKYINALNQALDNKELSQEKYNKAIEDLLPDEDEVYEILRTATTTDENIADKDKVKLQRDPETGFEYNPEVVHRHSYDNWMVAQPTPEHLFDTETIFGSQVRELIMSDLPDDFTVTINGRTYNKKEIREHYQALIVENLIEDFEKVRKNFDSIEDLQKALLNMIEDNPKYGREVLDAIQLVPDGNGGKMFNLPLNNPSTTAKLQEIISSMFKNQITKQHIKGGACILVSNFGFTNQLKLVYNKEGDSTSGIKYAECYMPAWSKEYFADFIDSNGNIDINEIPDNLKEIFAYRIPTEHKYSTLPLKVKGFLPIQNGSVIMLPAETVAFSGEDFDVDKKYIMMPEFNPITFKGKNKHNFVKDFIAYKESQGIPVKTDDVKIIADRIENNQELTEEDGHLEAEAYKFYKDNVSKYGTTTISKVQYDNTKTESENNRKQRNNEILDIMRGIITSPQIAEQTNHIGNFDNIKKVSRMIKILSNPVLTVEYIKENNLPENAASEVIASSILNKSFEDLNNFMKKHTTVHNILDPRTFEYYHKQNMTGDALIGMYANNSVAHAKYQDLGITVSNGFTFVLNGEKFNKISPIRNSNGELIAFNCAEFLAASVDNAKDPVLADLQQNANTANITAALLRMGVSIQDIGLLFNQPFIKDMIEKTGNLDKLPAFYISLTKMLKKYGQFITKENPAISSKDLVTNIIDNKDIRDSIEERKKDFVIVGDSKEVIPKLLQTIPSLRIMLRASAIAEDISILTSMSRGDSPTGALEITLGKALNQVRKVGTFHRRVERGLSTLENIEKVITNKAININNDAKTIREKLNSKDISMLQAFYTLGIENALPLMSRYFNQLNPVVIDVFNRVSDNCKRGMLPNTVYNRTVYTADNLLKDMITFALSDTKMFGNDEVNTYEQKRDYYIYEYPTKFMEILKDNPDLENYDTIKKLVVKKGRIQFENFTKMSTHTKNNLMSEIDLLLTSSNPVAQELIEDLIKYSYYTEQLSFGPRSFGTFISPKVLNAFPEYAEALRNVPSVMARKGKRFIEQVYAQHGLNILNTVRGVTEEGFLTVPMKEASNPNAPIDGLNDSDYVPYNYVKNRNGKTWNIYRYIGKTEDNKCAIYEVIPTYETIDGITYDANRETYEIKLDRNFSINRYAKLMATSGRIIKGKTAEQLAAKYSEGNFMEGFEKESLSEDEFNGLEDFSLEDSETTGLANFMGDTEVSKENTAEAENDFFSAIDAMEINDSTEASFDIKYDENKSQDSLENPMCK